MAENAVRLNIKVSKRDTATYLINKNVQINGDVQKFINKKENVPVEYYKVRIDTDLQDASSTAGDIVSLEIQEIVIKSKIAGKRPVEN